MKIGRNDPCPCGSGKKYKYCCLNNNKICVKWDVPENTAIRNIVNEQNYPVEMADVLCNLLLYMKKNNWIGACHATTAVMYVALSEIGLKPKACIGEVYSVELRYFDHSWIELNGKIIDLACSMTLLGGYSACAPIILDIDCGTGKKYDLKYGINYQGLDTAANHIYKTPFCSYLDAYPESKNGLWDVISVILDKEINIEELRNKYKDTKWYYIK